MMKKVLIVFVITGVIAASRAALIVNEQFDYAEGTYLEDVSGWSNQAGSAGAGVITGGTVLMKTQWNSKFLYSFSETYTLDSTETGADHKVSELWLHARVAVGVSSINHSARFGFDSSASSLNYNVYASSQLTIDTSGLLSIVRVTSQNQYTGIGSLPAYDGSTFVDVYGRLTDDDSGNLTFEIWFDPSDPNNLGTADASRTTAYAGSKIIDQIDLEAWGVANVTSYDSITIGTEISDVIPEPSTVGLFVVSGISCLFLRQVVQK